MLVIQPSMVIGVEFAGLIDTKRCQVVDIVDW